MWGCCDDEIVSHSVVATNADLTDSNLFCPHLFVYRYANHLITCLITQNQTPISVLHNSGHTGRVARGFRIRAHLGLYQLKLARQPRRWAGSTRYSPGALFVVQDIDV